MSTGNRMTLKFKKGNCGRCRLADKKALKKGKAHCKFDGKPRRRNGQCEEVKK